MPELGKTVGQVICALMGAVMIFGWVYGEAIAAEWPLVLPTSEFKNIPGGKGMSFFYGRWEQVSSRPQGGDLIVTGNKLVSPVSSEPPTDYRVLHTGANFVLMISKRPVARRSLFEIFAIQSLDEVRRWTTMRTHFCGDPVIYDPSAFQWPTSKLLDAFKKSRCLSKIELEDGSVTLGWSNMPWQWADAVY